jgi:hypothetical protein
MSRAKTTTVFPADRAVSIGDVLDDALGNEPMIGAEAQELIAAAQAGQLPGGAVGTAAAAGGDLATAAPGGDLAAPDPARDPGQAAATITAVLFTAGQAIGGAEWAPEDDAEAAEIRQAFQTYFEIRGAPPLPPELIVLAALGTYAGKRLKKPQTRERLRPILAGVPVIGKLLGYETPAPTAADERRRQAENDAAASRLSRVIGDDDDTRGAD